MDLEILRNVQPEDIEDAPEHLRELVKVDENSRIVLAILRKIY